MRIDRQQKLDRILVLYDAGMSQTTISARLGICRNTIREHLKANGRPLGHRYNLPDPPSGGISHHTRAHFVEHQ